MAFLHHHVGDLDIPAGSPVGREEAGVMAFLHHHVGDLDIPLVLLVREIALLKLLSKKGNFLAGFEQSVS